MPSIVAESVSPPPDYSDYLHVVIGIIENGSGEVLIAKRPDTRHQGGLWEFPGGKVEEDESVFNALQRELHEELSIEVVQAHPKIRIPYHYPDRKVLLDVWSVTLFHGEAEGAEGQPVAWVKEEALSALDFPAANRSILTSIRLPQHYLITPDPGTEKEWPEFLQKLRKCLEAGITLLQFRATNLNRSDYLKLAQQVSACCIDFDARLLLNADVSVFDECEAAGLHLTSARLLSMDKRPVGKEKLLAASCHTLEELKHAESIGADFVLLSPVKATTSHPDVQPLGWHSFHCLSENSSLPVFALGGMTHEDLPEAIRQGAQGIAAIRSLWCDA